MHCCRYTISQSPAALGRKPSWPGEGSRAGTAARRTEAGYRGGMDPTPKHGRRTERGFGKRTGEEDGDGLSRGSIRSPKLVKLFFDRSTQGIASPTRASQRSEPTNLDRRRVPPERLVRRREPLPQRRRRWIRPHCPLEACHRALPELLTGFLTLRHRQRLPQLQEMCRLEV